MDGTGPDPLLRSLAAGEERAFVVLYDRFADRMYRSAVRMLGRPEDAEDIVQDVFLAVVRSRERLSEVRDLAAYLFAALHRAAGQYAMRRARAPQILTAPADKAIAPTGQAATDTADWSRLQEAIRVLPDEQREVLTLRIDGELTFAQIAEVVGASIGTVASRYQYALKKLRTSLAAARPSREGSRQ